MDDSKGPCPRVVIIGPWKGSFFFFQYLNFDDDDQMDVIVNFIKQFPHMEKRVIFISIMTKMSKHALHFAGVFIGMVPSLKNKTKKKKIRNLNLSLNFMKSFNFLLLENFVKLKCNFLEEIIFKLEPILDKVYLGSKVVHCEITHLH